MSRGTGERGAHRMGVLSEEPMANRVAHLFSVVLIVALLAGCNPLRSTSIVSAPTPVLSEGEGPTAPAAPPSPTPLPSPSATPTPPPTPTATPTPQPTPTPVLAATPSASLLGLMEAIEEEMESIRGLDETLPITRSLMTREQLAAYMAGELAREYPPEEVGADVRVLAAFDFVPRDFDLHQLLVDLYSAQAIGLYDEERNTLYVITDAAEGFDVLARTTFAHEYVHSLQDQHFALDNFVDEEWLNDDEIMARLALVEGDAFLAMMQYLFLHLNEITAEDMELLQSAGGEAGQEVLDAAPPVIRETFLFPYTYGLAFAMALQEQGWQAVDAAYADPPRSTEQILHPEKYTSGDEPQIVPLPPLTDTLGAGWHLVEAETLGEFQTNLYLAQRVDQKTADLAGQGWDGDRYALYIRDSADLLVFATAWDSPADAEEFAAAYRQYAEGKYGRPPTHSSETEAWWETPVQTAALMWEGPAALLILGPDRATVEKVLAALR